MCKGEYYMEDLYEEAAETTAVNPVNELKAQIENGMKSMRERRDQLAVEARQTLNPLDRLINNSRVEELNMVLNYLEAVTKNA